MKLCPFYVLTVKKQKNFETRGDSLLQDLALRRLREAKVHHLVEQLVDDDEVVSYGLLLDIWRALLSEENFYDEEKFKKWNKIVRKTNP